MELLNQIGHIQHWGLTPAANVLAQWPSKDETVPLKLLFSGCSDIRHILKTLCDWTGNNQVQIYLHETKKELLCRALLLLHVLHETHLSFDERVELFLDIYGNALVKERTARYIHVLREDLLNFIHDQKNVRTPIRKLVSLKHLRFDVRDEMSEIVQSWSIKANFDMAKCRDQKLRYHFKERYDYRANLVDWDYNTLLIPCAPIVHYYHYKEWRLSGLAYEQRFSSYCQPNRTLASYAPGRKKDQRTSCLVRGYWGDIVVSPYVALGTLSQYHQDDLLYKKANYKFIGHSVEISQYNLNYWLHRLEKDQLYTRVFRDYYRTDDKGRDELERIQKQKKSKKKPKSTSQTLPTESIPEQNQTEQGNQETEENDTNNQEKDNSQQEKQEKQEKQKKQEKQENTSTEERPIEEFQQKQKSETVSTESTSEVLDSDEEQERKLRIARDSKVFDPLTSPDSVLFGFSKRKATIHLLADQPQQFLTKAKFNQFFDLVTLGFGHSAYLSRNVGYLVKPGGQLVVENASFIVPKKPDERKELNSKIHELVKQNDASMKLIKESEALIFFEKQVRSETK